MSDERTSTGTPITRANSPQHEHITVSNPVTGETVGTVPNATPDEVRRATRTLVDGMTAGGGGYILAASHTIPPETSVENIFAMYEEAGISREAAFDRAADIRARLVASHRNE